MIGGVFSGLATLASAASERQNQKKALKQQQENIEKGRQLVDQGYDDIDDYLAVRKNTIDSRKLTTDEDVQKYRDLISGYDPEDYVAERGTFNKDGYDVEDYLNENREAILQKTANAVQRTAAGAGIGRGTGAATDVAQAVLDADEELYDKAYERMKDDRDFDYNEFQNTYQANQARLDKLSEGIQTQMSVLGGAIQTDQQAEDDYISDLIASKTGRVNAEVSLLT